MRNIINLSANIPQKQTNQNNIFEKNTKIQITNYCFFDNENIS